jgi:hypothetical protein
MEKAGVAAGVASVSVLEKTGLETLSRLSVPGLGSLANG